MAGMGHELVVLTSAFGDLPRDEIPEGYRVIRIPTLRRFKEKCRVYEMVVFMFMAIFYSLKLVRRWRPDISIAFFTLPSGPAAYLLRLFHRIPYVISLRGGDVPGFLPGILSFYHRLTGFVTRHIWRRAHAIVANSQGLKDLAIRADDTIAISTIPNGVDPAFFQKDDSCENAPIPRLLTVGRLTEQKGIDTLLKAFSLLKVRYGKPLQLWIVGDGPLRHDLESLAHGLHIHNDVSFLGWVEPEHVRNFYATSTVFVLPSLNEGMPNVVLEAMAMGLPIVATCVAGSEDLVEDGKNGYLVSPQNPELLAEKLFDILAMQKAETMGAASLEIVKKLDWGTVAADYVKICEEAA